MSEGFRKQVLIGIPETHILAPSGCTRPNHQHIGIIAFVQLLERTLYGSNRDSQGRVAPIDNIPLAKPSPRGTRYSQVV
jgi:hypothetical protein